jgi:hypothetical protein
MKRRARQNEGEQVTGRKTAHERRDNHEIL